MENNNSIEVRYLRDSFVTKDKKLRTSIRTGYGLYYKNNIAYLDEEIIPREENKVVLGGILHLLGKLFGTQSSITVSTLNELLGVATVDYEPVTGANDLVFAFNVGLDGCAAAFTDQKAVLDQENCVPGIIPIRVVDSPDELGTDINNYWFQKKNTDGKYWFYLKNFETAPVVHTLWKDSTEEDGDGTPVTGNPGVESPTNTSGIESFVEVVLNITAKDIREWFELYDNPDFARFNSLGLCVGTKGASTVDGEEEYIGVTQFSVLNFANEMLHFDKDLSIIYRIYIS